MVDRMLYLDKDERDSASELAKESDEWIIAGKI